MNPENIDLLIAAMTTRTDYGFNMGAFKVDRRAQNSSDQVLSGRGPAFYDQSGHNCNTVLCMGGWSVLLATGNLPARAGELLEEEWQAAADFLDLEVEELHELFVPRNMIGQLQNIPLARAISALEYVKKGEPTTRAWMYAHHA